MSQPVQHYSNNVSYLNQMDNIYNARKSIGEAQEKISSGYIAKTYKDLSDLGMVEGTVDNKLTISTYRGIINNNNYVISKIDTMDIAIDNVIDQLTEFRGNLVLKISVNSKYVDLASSGKSSLAIIMENLNSRYQGKYVFSGSRINVAPVGNIVNTSNLVDGNISANYYHGDAIRDTAKISSNITIEYGVMANNTAFQETIGAINKSLTASNKSEYGEAVDMVAQALEDLIKLRSQLKYQRVQIVNTNDNLDTMSSFYSTQLSDTVATNIEDMATQIANDTLILTAAFQTYGALSKLSLINYL